MKNNNSITIKNSSNIDIKNPKNYFEEFYSDVWKNNITESIVSQEDLNNLLTLELIYEDAKLLSFDYSDSNYYIEFLDDNTYLKFKTKWENNTRLEKMAAEAGFMDSWFSESGDDCKQEIMKFAQLIIEECQELNVYQSYELSGVIIDTENSEFDAICLNTVKRVEQYLSGDNLKEYFNI